LSELSPLKQAFLALQEAQQRIAALEAARTEPIAIVGIGARIPGAEDGPEAFWSLLRDQRDAVSDRLPARWRELQAAGAEEMPDSARYAALLERPDLFDAEFFGISPREAAGIDPQQRMLLEVTWEALEHAGIAPTALYGSKTGVFVGIAASDYSLLRLATTDRTEIDGHFGSDIALSIAAGRISYVLGLRGPAMSLDTACSSSLVATHLACDALRRNECTLALAGGVNAILSTEGSRTFAKSGMLSPEGRCKSFAAAADGYVRGEGCGVVVLKRLSQAQADGDRVLAVLLGSAINHDGPSSGLTVPSGRAQQAVVRAALEAAKVQPHDIGYVEAHGTGTSLGDPIEAEALGAVFAATRPADRPLLIGSVKTNVGHLEAASGIAGLIKLVLALVHRELPAHLHFDAPSPHIRWDALGLEVVDRHRSWEPIGDRRLAGISAFGFSGTNAHLVVAEAPAPRAPAGEAERPIEILILSARSETALRALAGGYAARLDAQPECWADLCHTANVGRAPFAHRLSVRAADADALRAGLGAYLAGADDPRVVVSQSSAVPPKIGFLFTGQGAQYAGMSRALYASSPVVRRMFDAADALLAGRLDIPLGAVVRGEHADAARLINLTLYTQPALYVLECALAELLRELGVDPHAVIGHSLGEYAAAAVTGVFGFADGLLLVADRARMMHEVTADGAMLVVNASEAQVAPLLDGYADRVSVAGINAPSQVTISGARAAIEEIAASCAERGWRTVPLPVSQAFHSPLLEEMSVAFESRAAQLSYEPPNRKLVSNLTGAAVDRINAAYWRAHTREAVRFADGVRALDALGCDVLVEIGPRPTLLPLAQLVHGSAGSRRYVATLKAAGQDWDSLAQAVQQLHAAGVSIDWSAWDRSVTRAIVDAPTYPFERRRHWIVPSKRPASVRASANGAHSLLGARLRSALPGTQFEAELVTADATAWLGDHRINGSALLPATALIEMMLAAGAACDLPLPALSDLAIFAPLRVGDQARAVQTIVDAPAGGSATVRIFAAEDDDRFRLHAQGRLTAASVADAEVRGDFAAIRARCTDERDAAQHYARMAESGADFGPAFLGVARMWSGEGEALSEVHATVGAAMNGTQRPHPALLDACLQTAAGALVHGGATYMPITLARLDLLADRWPDIVFSHARVTLRSDDAPQLDVTVYATDGTPLARAGGLTFKRIDGAVVRDDPGDQSSWFYDLAWRKTPVPAPAAPSNAPVLVTGSGPLADGIAAALRSAGRSVDLHAAADAERSIAELNGHAKSVGVVVCVSPEPHDPGDDGPLSGRAGVEALLALCKHHVGDGAFGGARLYVVTRNAHAVEPGDAPALADAALSGLAATALTEFPELRCTRIDVDPASTAAPGTDVAREIVAAADDDWVAYRHGTRFAARIERAAGIERIAAPALALRSSGSLDSIAWLPAERATLRPDEVEIEVVAAPLNFRDVVSAVGMFSDAMPLGAECAGIVSRVGSAVTRFTAGDEVVAFAPGALASFAVVTQRLVVAKPPAFSFASAASQALVYLTADYALNAVAAMQPGERVLIHAAAGGVGLAAVELCRRAGVTIFATAGSEAKRAHLRGLGVEHVMDSRSLLFADQVREATNGRGVDVVLNSLAGAFVDAGLSVTAPGGRFVEIGKTDVRETQQIATQYPGVTYTAVDLIDQFRDEPEQSIARLTAIFDRIASGELAAVPYRTYSAAQAQTAFRDLAAARHLGKLVLALERPAAAPVVRTGGTYLITGGLAGIGSYLGGWLLERGAGRVVLLGRSAPSPETNATIATWREAGADVVVRRADVTQYEEVAAAVRDAGPSLRGVIHCASVLDDAPIGELSWERFATVMRPKALGAWNLHRATSSTPLDFFVVFSSWASLVGARGGANYTAANLALDSLAHLRRAHGLPALSIDWGAWSEIGWATRVAGGLPVRPGFAPMSPAQGARALETALHLTGSAQVAIAPIDWPVLVARAGRSLPSVCADLIASYGRSAVAPATSAIASLADVLGAASPRSRTAVAVGHLRELAAKALGIEDAATIDPEQPLADLGMDSILAVELRNTVARSLRADVATTLLFDYPTIAALAGFAVALIAPAATGAGAVVSVEDAELLDFIERLSDEEVDRRLAQRGADVA